MDYYELARLQLERDLVSAEGIGDKEWVKQIHAELKRIKSESESAKPAAEATATKTVAKKAAAKKTTATKTAAKKTTAKKATARKGT